MSKTIKYASSIMAFEYNIFDEEGKLVNDITKIVITIAAINSLPTVDLTIKGNNNLPDKLFLSGNYKNNTVSLEINKIYN